MLLDDYRSEQPRASENFEGISKPRPEKLNVSFVRIAGAKAKQPEGILRLLCVTNV